MNWNEWNNNYDIPDSKLAKRLNKVKEYLKSSLSNIESPTVLSICSGQGRDILESMLELNKEGNIFLIDTDQNCLNYAINFTNKNKINKVTFINDDASEVSTYRNYKIPKCDIILVCGLFGHLDEQDSHNVISFLKTQIKNNGIVIWTKNTYDDSVSDLRKYFISNNFKEINHFSSINDFWSVVYNQYTGKEEQNIIKYKFFNFINRH